MTQSRQRALWSLLLWGGVTVSFVILFFARGGPEPFVRDKTRIVITAALFGAGYVAQLSIFYLTRVRRWDRSVAWDERDDWIARNANGVAFLVASIYVFGVSIGLWEVYHDRELVPVGWMWFLAYTSTFVGMFTHAIATLILDARVGGHGEQC
jgi:hypothetical protein